MGVLSQILSFTIYGYSIPQILGVFLIVVIAIGVVIYFSTIWAVTRTKNVGKTITPIKSDDKLRYSGLGGISPSNQPIRLDVYIDRNNTHQKEEMEHFDQNTVTVLEARYSYEIMVHHLLKFQTGSKAGKARTYFLENITDEKIFKNDGTTIIQTKAEYTCDASFVEEITDVSYDVIIEYSADQNDPIGYLNQTYMDELTNAYLITDPSDLKSESNPLIAELDTLPQEFDRIRREMPSLIDNQPCIRSLLFLLFYKILDPGFRSIGLEAIQKFTVLMSMHVELVRRMFLYEKLDADQTESNLDRSSNIRKIHTVEEMIRRFVCKYVTNTKRRADIFDIMNQYSLAIINSDQKRKTEQNSINSEVDFSDDVEYQKLIKMTEIIDTDLTVISLSTKMYSEIMVSLADPDSPLYSDQISRLYAMLCPLYNILSENNLFYGMNNAEQVKDTILPIYLNNIQAYLQNIRSQKSQSQPEEEVMFLDALHYDYSVDTPISESDEPNIIEDRKDNEDNEGNEGNEDNGMDSLIEKLNSIIDLTWKVYGFNQRLLNGENKSTYLLMK